MTSVTLARNAMATRFEVVLHGERPMALRAAGEQALDEIERLEAQLSLYRSSSEISSINAQAARKPVQVEPTLFRLLQRAAELHQHTQGAFDITIAPLMHCWGFLGGSGRRPCPEELSAARACVGMHLVELDPQRRTVRFQHPGVMLDLGSIGKGFAIERAIDVLLEAGMTSALLHGGTSTIAAIGHPPEEPAWNIAIEHPAVAAAGKPFAIAAPDQSRPLGRHAVLAIVPLRDESLSVSAVWGKGFEEDGKLLGHVMDPRTGQPAGQSFLAAVTCPSATDSDALSTALLTLGEGGHETLAAVRPDLRSFLVACAPHPPGFQISHRRLPPLDPPGA